MSEQVSLTLKDFLTRVDFVVSREQVITRVVKDFSLGTVREIIPLPFGNEEFNCRVKTDEGDNVWFSFRDGIF